MKLDISSLPDDIVDKIYSKIYFPQNSKLLNEIKIHYYIINKLVIKYGLYNLCCCAIIHDKNINAISMSYIDNIHDIIYELDDKDRKRLLNRIIGGMSLNKKYSFIFFITDRTIRSHLTDNIDYIKYVVDNSIIY
jgi:hypothetical protein